MLNRAYMQDFSMAQMPIDYSHLDPPEGTSYVPLTEEEHKILEANFQELIEEDKKMSRIIERETICYRASKSVISECYKLLGYEDLANQVLIAHDLRVLTAFVIILERIASSRRTPQHMDVLEKLYHAWLI